MTSTAWLACTSTALQSSNERSSATCQPGGRGWLKLLVRWGQLTDAAGERPCGLAASAAGTSFSTGFGPHGLWFVGVYKPGPQRDPGPGELPVIVKTVRWEMDHLQVNLMGMGLQGELGHI